MSILRTYFSHLDYSLIGFDQLTLTHTNRKRKRENIMMKIRIEVTVTLKENEAIHKKIMRISKVCGFIKNIYHEPDV